MLYESGEMSEFEYCWVKMKVSEFVYDEIVVELIEVDVLNELSELLK